MFCFYFAKWWLECNEISKNIFHIKTTILRFISIITIAMANIRTVCSKTAKTFFILKQEKINKKYTLRMLMLLKVVEKWPAKNRKQQNSQQQQQQKSNFWFPAHILYQEVGGRPDESKFIKKTKHKITKIDCMESHTHKQTVRYSVFKMNETKKKFYKPEIFTEKWMNEK